MIPADIPAWGLTQSRRERMEFWFPPITRRGPKSTELYGGWTPSWVRERYTWWGPNLILPELFAKILLSSTVYTTQQHPKSQDVFLSETVLVSVCCILKLHIQGLFVLHHCPRIKGLGTYCTETIKTSHTNDENEILGV